MGDITKRFGWLFPLLLLFVVEVVLFLANYKQGTFLVGWDNLYPELNFRANFSRSLFSVWQEYRGLGLLDGMAHAANLPHTLLLWLLSQFLPLSLLRWVFIFGMHFLGGVGLYFFLRSLMQESLIKQRIIALSGALFYLFNLATIQMFYAPLEVFAVHFAFLPWLIFFLRNFLIQPKFSNLLLFTVFSVFSLPQGFVPQIFLVYLIAVFSLCFAYLVRGGIKAISNVLVICFVIFSLNAFWGLPYLYSIPSNSETILNAKINQMSSEDIYLKNKERGSFGDVIFLKGFMLDVSEYTKDGSYNYIMTSWRQHIETILFKTSAFFLLLMTFLGILLTFLKKQKKVYPFLVCFIISLFFLGNNIVGLDFLNNLFREKIPIVGEAFRFSFTKFSILFVFCYTVFFGLGLNFFYGFLQKYIQKSFWTKLLIFSVFPIIFLYTFPSFRGNFIFNLVKLQIPNEYFQTIDFFERQNINTRIATFPQANFWNWRFHKGGYRGSGFLWYGISQPILDRAFDPWSGKNENYYWEISYALYSQNRQLFEKVLEKYQINWLLVDGNVINPSSNKALFVDELTQMLANSDKVLPEKTFGNIRIYKTILEAPVEKFVFLTNNLPTTGPKYDWNNDDRAYLENGNYITSDSQLASYYPFRSLFTGRSQDDLEFTVEEENDSFTFKRNIPAYAKDFSLVLPQLSDEELILVDPGNLADIKFFKPEVSFEQGLLKVRIPKIWGHFSARIDPAKDLSLEKVKSGRECNKTNSGQARNAIIQKNAEAFVRLKAIDVTNCTASFWFPNLDHRLGYLITAQSQNVSGKSLLFWLENLNIRKADIETYLPQKPQQPAKSYFIQPPMDQYGLGYSLHFDNISIGQQESVNDLGLVTVNQIPYNFLTQIKLVPKDFVNPAPSYISNFTVSHPNPSFYQVALHPTPSTLNPTLVLSQSYSSGWQAYYIDSKLQTVNSKLGGILAPFAGKRITDHILVNNWENGWILSGADVGNSTIVIIYLPQLLEYFGFFLLLSLPGILLLLFHKNCLTNGHLGQKTLSL